MRKKMMKNDMFYIHYPYRPNLEDSVSIACLMFLLIWTFSKAIHYYICDNKTNMTTLNSSCK